LSRAAAARGGRFDEAWAEMLREYDRDDRSSLPEGCRLAGRDEDCPEASEIIPKRCAFLVA
jgi:hypothetical protein